MKTKKIWKHMGISIAVLGVLVFGLFILYQRFFDPYRGTISTISKSKDLSTTLSKEDALEDLSYILEKLKERHPACMHGIPEEILTQYHEETLNLTSDVTVLKLWQAAARILAKMKDAHTNISYYGDDPSRLPLTFQLDDGELYCTSKGFTNNIVKKINGVPLIDLYETYLDQCSYELENYAAYNFSRKLSLKSFLDFIGVDTSRDISITFLTETGESEVFFAFELTQEDATPQENPFVSYDLDEVNHIGILTLRSCQYNDTYQDTVREFFTKVKANDIQYIAVDLRNNGGGNSMVANEFFRYLDVEEYYVAGGVDIRYGPFLQTFKKSLTKNKRVDDLLFTGKVYALTSDDTFSSAKMFANMIMDNQIGQIIGEIPGNMPASFGDILFFQTPNAKLALTVSFKFFGRIDESRAHLPLIPDYEVKAEDAIDTLYQLIKSQRN